LGFSEFSVDLLHTRTGIFFWPVRPVWKLAQVIVVKQLADCRGEGKRCSMKVHRSLKARREDFIWYSRAETGSVDSSR